MIHFVYLAALALIILWFTCQRWEDRADWQRQLEHERRMRLVAEAAIESFVEAWAEQLSINRYRVSEAERAMRKSPRGGEPN